MDDVPTAVLYRIPDDAPTEVLDRADDTVQLWHLLDEMPLWPIVDRDPPLTAGDPRQHPRPSIRSQRWATSTNTLERVLDGLRQL